MKSQAQSVTQVVSQVKSTLEAEFRQVWVEGEVTNVSSSATGHWYFGLSDHDSYISCALFKTNAFRNPGIKKVQDGDRIQVFGNLNVYGKRGTFQIVVTKVLLLDKEGALKRKFEKVKAKLQMKGLFDHEHKLPIPSFPKCIGLITAQGSAAESDFLNILKRRSLWFHIKVIPSLMQGETAAGSIREALQQAIADMDIDVIVISRGGGSLEDLWAFNDEKLAEDIFNSPKPVISAIGHEVDYCICDYVSDMRCETPSAAAETLSGAQVELYRRMESAFDKMKLTLLQFKEGISRQMQRVHPKNMLHLIKDQLHLQKQRLREVYLMDQSDRLLKLNDYRFNLDEKITTILSLVKEQTKSKSYQLDHWVGLIKAYDPRHTLKRGYSIVFDQDGKAQSSAKDFNNNENDQYKITFHDGDAHVQKVPF